MLAALVEGDDERGHEGGLLEMFRRWDLDFFPASPARAPFLDLLVAAPSEGLRLVRGVVAHAVRMKAGDRPGDDRLTIPFPSGARPCPWWRSYTWARGQPSSIVSSALMALEAWSHLRVEKGDSLPSVIDDVLGPDGGSAAYVLVAVDVMLSHWPASREWTWPFGASAMLLALDEQRWRDDVLNGDDYGKLWVKPEPPGIVKWVDLRKRGSRRTTLRDVVRRFGCFGPDEIRSEMRSALTRQAAELGVPDTADLEDPRFCAMHALNLLEPANHVSAIDEQTGHVAWRYVPPPEEEKLERESLESAAAGSTAQSMYFELTRSIAQQRSSDALLQRGLAWARGASPKIADLPPADTARARFLVAALVLRDGSDELKEAHGAWARDQLGEVVNQPVDRTVGNDALPYHAPAIAAVGLLASCAEGSSADSLKPLLDLAARPGRGMVSALSTVGLMDNPPSEQLLRALVRLGFASTIYGVARRIEMFTEGFNEKQDAADATAKQATDTMRSNAVQAELLWLTARAPEPPWPSLPDPVPPRRRHRMPGAPARADRQRRAGQQRAMAMSHDIAAQWMSLATDLWGRKAPQTLRELINHCWPWTASANGVDANPDEDPGELASSWNDSYFAAALVVGLSRGMDGLRHVLLQPMSMLRSEQLFDAIVSVLHRMDRLWLGEGVIDDATAVAIRETLASQLQGTRGWKYHVTDLSGTTEVHLAEAVAAMFMGEDGRGIGRRCYLMPVGAARADIVLPLLTQLTESAARSVFVANAFLALLEVDPQAGRFEFLARAVKAWWDARGVDAAFWMESGSGARVVAWIEKAFLVSQDAAVNFDQHGGLAETLDVLIHSGIPTANSLSARLRSRASR